MAYFTGMSHRRLVAAGGLCAVALTACSSAPAPASLDNPTPAVSLGGTTGGSGAGSTTGQPQQAAGTTGSRPGGTTGVAGPSSAGGRTTGGTAGGGTSGATGGATSGSYPPDTSSVHLFTPKEDRIGITPTSLTMCAHAALTYAPAFKTDVKDLNVFWTAINTEKGGIYGRKVNVTYENDNYDPQTAVTAAKTCVAKNIFMLLGGIGFDQIPTVRNYAESVHQLYLYHTATINGSQNLKYSFTELPTVERTGEAFAQLALQKYKGKKIGILERDSSNWSPGVDAFKKVKGLDIVDEEKVPANAGNYTSQITNLRNSGAQVVWIWLNAVETTEVVEQMKSQAWSPNLMVFPFNLTSQTLGNDAMNPPMDGVAMYPAYSDGDYTGTFAAYQDDMKEFKAQYAKYDGGANGPDLSGVAGDLLFLNWVGQKALYRQFLLCGKDCTRNKFVEVLQHYDQVPVSSGCRVDFVHGDHHHGATDLTFMQTYKSPSGKINWRETKQCVGQQS